MRRTALLFFCFALLFPVLASAAAPAPDEAGEAPAPAVEPSSPVLYVDLASSTACGTVASEALIPGLEETEGCPETCTTGLQCRAAEDCCVGSFASCNPAGFCECIH